MGFFTLIRPNLPLPTQIRAIPHLQNLPNCKTIKILSIMPFCNQYVTHFQKK